MHALLVRTESLHCISGDNQSLDGLAGRKMYAKLHNRTATSPRNPFTVEESQSVRGISPLAS